MVSRPRRFGKSFAAQSIAAFYSVGCDSRALFEGREVSRREEFMEELWRGRDGREGRPSRRAAGRGAHEGAHGGISERPSDRISSPFGSRQTRKKASQVADLVFCGSPYQIRTGDLRLESASGGHFITSSYGTKRAFYLRLYVISITLRNLASECLFTRMSPQCLRTLLRVFISVNLQWPTSDPDRGTPRTGAPRPGSPGDLARPAAESGPSQTAISRDGSPRRTESRPPPDRGARGPAGASSAACRHSGRASPHARHGPHLGSASARDHRHHLRGDRPRGSVASYAEGAWDACAHMTYKNV